MKGTPETESFETASRTTRTDKSCLEGPPEEPHVSPAQRWILV